MNNIKSLEYSKLISIELLGICEPQKNQVDRHFLDSEYLHIERII